MKHSPLILLATLMLLAACSGSHRPVYSGREESTEGVPGFVNGKKVSPHVKLGQSYSVDGETYVPRNQPDYIEEGMASWYGPGFHGGKTANGERFDAADLTAAHRTLPLPSIVKVTMVSTGKSTYVRVNDRGPFARSRIIDLSRAAADKIGLVRTGVAKVRVEYMKPESERFAQLLAQGRDPKSIDVANEVIRYTAEKQTELAQAAPLSESKNDAAAEKESPWSKLNPVRSAEAAEPTAEVSKAAPVTDVVASDLQKTEQAAETAPAADEKQEDPSPFAALEEPPAMAPPKEQVAMTEPSNIPPSTAPPELVPKSEVSGYYVKLGAFLKMENAKKVSEKFATIAKAEIVQKPNAKGQQLYHVRMGPYVGKSQGEATLAKVKAAGGEDARVVHE